MDKLAVMRTLLLASVVGVSGCATRPVNPPLASVDQSKPYYVERKGQSAVQSEGFVVLTFSGGGTRAAAFSYGVLEALRRTEIKLASGETVRLIDQIDLITGISGGSFTALAYGLYGEKLFAEYEQRFLKRNVQGDLVARAFNPLNWGKLLSTGWGRTEMAADLYDEILFNQATFADLQRTDGPLIMVSATDITSGSRVVFNSPNFDVMCADLGTIRIARAAAASSAVPVVLSPLTLNNYGGRCGYRFPAWAQLFLNNPDPPRPAARLLKRLNELQGLASGDEPYLHLVDGGISDNLGLRSVLDVLELFEALHEAGLRTPLDRVRRIVVIVVDSKSEPATEWAKLEDPPGTLSILVKAAGVPIDRYSGEQVELLRDIEARWKMLRQIRDSAAFSGDADPTLAFVKNVPNAELYAIEVSFSAFADPTERAFLNQLPTTFVLKPEEVDRLRAAAGRILLESPDFKRLLGDIGARVVDRPRTGAVEEDESGRW